jgi:hypothetical protein
MATPQGSYTTGGTDRILYTVTTAGGGQDGRDHTDLGGHEMLATFDKAVAEKFIGKDSRYILTPSVITLEAAQKAALHKLSPLDILVLDITINKTTGLPVTSRMESR